MKALRAGLALVMMLAAGLGFAATTKPGAAGHKTAETPATIEGVQIARPNGGFLGLRIVNNNFVLSFYDAAKKKTAPDVTRASLRWSVKYQPQDERALLTVGSDGTSLTGAKNVRPPHNFRVFLGLFVDGNDSAVESYTVEVQPPA